MFWNHLYVFRKQHIETMDTKRDTYGEGLKDSAVARLLVKGRLQNHTQTAPEESKMESAPTREVIEQEPPLDLSFATRKKSLINTPNLVHNGSMETGNHTSSTEDRKRKCDSPETNTPPKRKCPYCPFTAQDTHTLYSHYQFHKQILAGPSRTSASHLEWIHSYVYQNHKDKDLNEDQNSHSPAVTSNDKCGSTLRTLLQSPEEQPVGSQTASHYLKSIVKNIIQQKASIYNFSSGQSSRASSRPITPRCESRCSSRVSSPDVLSTVCESPSSNCQTTHAQTHILHQTLSANASPRTQSRTCSPTSFRESEPIDTHRHAPYFQKMNIASPIITQEPNNKTVEKLVQGLVKTAQHWPASRGIAGSVDVFQQQEGASDHTRNQYQLVEMKEEPIDSSEYADTSYLSSSSISVDSEGGNNSYLPQSASKQISTPKYAVSNSSVAPGIVTQPPYEREEYRERRESELRHKEHSQPKDRTSENIATITHHSNSDSSTSTQVADSATGDMCQSRCQHCGITFEDEVIFSIHMGCHNHRDPFICNVCGRACGNKYAFYTHIMRGHEYAG